MKKADLARMSRQELAEELALLKRTAAEKRQAVIALLTSSRWRYRSVKAIATQARVSQYLVMQVLEEFAAARGRKKRFIRTDQAGEILDYTEGIDGKMHPAARGWKKARGG